MTPTIERATASAVKDASDTPLRMTWEEYLDWLDEDKHAEWVNGEVVMHSPVSRTHNNIGRFLMTITSAWLEHTGAGELFYEPFQMRTGPDLPLRCPDLFVVLEENKSRVKENLLDGPADLAIEIISPESRTRDRCEKFYEYEAGGVREYWMLDSKRTQAEFYQRGADGFYRVVLPDASGIYQSAVLPGFFLDTNWLWQTPLPSLISVLKNWNVVP